MKIIFLHGLESTPETSGSGRAIAEAFPGAEIPHYFTKGDSFEVIRERLEEIILGHLDRGEEIALVGISFGGFWAYYMASYMPHIAHCILLNPSLKFYPRVKVTRNPSLPLTIIMNGDDVVVDNRWTFETFKDSARCILHAEGGHRMTNMQDVIKDIKKALNTPVGL